MPWVAGPVVRRRGGTLPDVGGGSPRSSRTQQRRTRGCRIRVRRHRDGSLLVRAEHVASGPPGRRIRAEGAHELVTSTRWAATTRRTRPRWHSSRGRCGRCATAGSGCHLQAQLAQIGAERGTLPHPASDAPPAQSVRCSACATACTTSPALGWLPRSPSRQ